MNCLYCGKRLSLLHKLSGREFCTEQHHTQYVQDQETMGLARLIEAKQVSGAKQSGTKKKGRAKVPETPRLAEIFSEESPRIQTVVKEAFVPGSPVWGAVGVALPSMDRELGPCQVPTCGAKVMVLDLERAEQSDVERTAAPLFHPAIKLPEPELSCAPRVQIPVAGPLAETHLPGGTWPGSPERIAPEHLIGSESTLRIPEVWVKSALRTGLRMAAGGRYTASERNGWKPMVAVRPKPFRIGEILPSEAPSSITALGIKPGPGVLERLAELTADLVALTGPKALVGPGFRPAEPPEATPLMVTRRIPSTAPSTVYSLPRQRRSVEALGAPVARTPAVVVAAEPQQSGTKLTKPPAPEARVEAKLSVAVRSDATVTGPTVDGAPEWSSPEPVAALVSMTRPAALPAKHQPELGQARLAAPNLGGPVAEGVPAIESNAVEPAPPPCQLPREAAAIIEKQLGQAPDPLPLDVVGAEAGSTAAQPPPAIRAAARWETPTAELLMPRADAPTLSGEDSFSSEMIPAPAAAGLLPLSLDRIVPSATIEVNHGDREPTTGTTQAVLPRLKLEPVEDRVIPKLPDNVKKRRAWMRAWPPLAGKLSSAPAGMKWSVMAVPLIALLAFHSLTKDSTPRTAPPMIAVNSSEAVQAPPASTAPSLAAKPDLPEGPPLQKAVATQTAKTSPKGRWQTFQENIMHRAAISLADDFRNGLGNWAGGGDWARSWSYDKAGFIRPGSLALYVPTVSLSDYQFEFTGQIEQGGLSWVFRASDLKNYYAERLVITAPGSMPEAALIRYAVVNGKRTSSTQTPLPFRLRNGRMYRFRVEVRGTRFTTYLDDSVIDFFSDSRLKRGGIGFFRGRGEKSRLRWVSVMHQYDMLGRLCALIAPHNLENPPRSWNQ